MRLPLNPWKSSKYIQQENTANIQRLLIVLVANGDRAKKIGGFTCAQWAQQFSDALKTIVHFANEQLSEFRETSSNKDGQALVSVVEHPHSSVFELNPSPFQLMLFLAAEKGSVGAVRMLLGWQQQGNVRLFNDNDKLIAHYYASIWVFSGAPETSGWTQIQQMLNPPTGGFAANKLPALHELDMSVLQNITYIKKNCPEYYAAIETCVKVLNIHDETFRELPADYISQITRKTSSAIEPYEYFCLVHCLLCQACEYGSQSFMDYLEDAIYVRKSAYLAFAMGPPDMVLKKHLTPSPIQLAIMHQQYDLLSSWISDVKFNAGRRPISVDPEGALAYINSSSVYREIANGLLPLAVDMNMDIAERLMKCYEFYFIHKAMAYIRAAERQCNCVQDNFRVNKPKSPLTQEALEYLQKAKQLIDEEVNDKTPQFELSDPSNKALAHALRAKIALIRNDLSSAQHDVDKALGIDPEHAMSLAFRAEVLFAQVRVDDSYQDALKAKDLCMQQDVAHPWVCMMIVKLDLHHGFYSNALETINKIVAHDNHFSMGWAVKATVHMVKNEWRDAHKALKIAIHLDPNNDFAYGLEAKLLTITKQTLDKVMRAAQKALELNANNEMALWAIAVCYYTENKCEQALADINFAIRIAEKDTSCYQIFDFLPHCFILRADIHIAQGNFAQAEEDCQQCQSGGYKLDNESQHRLTVSLIKIAINKKEYDRANYLLKNLRKQAVESKNVGLRVRCSYLLGYMGYSQQHYSYPIDCFANVYGSAHLHLGEKLDSKEKLIECLLQHDKDNLQRRGWRSIVRVPLNPSQAPIQSIPYSLNDSIEEGMKVPGYRCLLMTPPAVSHLLELIKVCLSETIPYGKDTHVYFAQWFLPRQHQVMKSVEQVLEQGAFNKKAILENLQTHFIQPISQPLYKDTARVHIDCNAGLAYALSQNDWNNPNVICAQIVHAILLASVHQQPCDKTNIFIGQLCLLYFAALNKYQFIEGILPVLFCQYYQQAKKSDGTSYPVELRQQAWLLMLVYQQFKTCKVLNTITSWEAGSVDEQNALKDYFTKELALRTEDSPSSSPTRDAEEANSSLMDTGLEPPNTAMQNKEEVAGRLAAMPSGSSDDGSHRHQDAASSSTAWICSGEIDSSGFTTQQLYDIIDQKLNDIIDQSLPASTEASSSNLVGDIDRTSLEAAEKSQKAYDRKQRETMDKQAFSAVIKRLKATPGGGETKAKYNCSRFVEALFHYMKTGDITPPKPTPSGWHANCRPCYINGKIVSSSFSRTCKLATVFGMRPAIDDAPRKTDDPEVVITKVIQNSERFLASENTNFKESFRKEMSTRVEKPSDCYYAMLVFAPAVKNEDGSLPPGHVIFVYKPADSDGIFFMDAHNNVGEEVFDDLETYMQERPFASKVFWLPLSPYVTNPEYGSSANESGSEEVAASSSSPEETVFREATGPGASKKRSRQGKERESSDVGQRQRTSPDAAADFSIA